MDYTLGNIYKSTDVEEEVMPFLITAKCCDNL
jgi:hypothetical protein